MGEKVVIHIEETDGINTDLESDRDLTSIYKKVRPYLHSYKIIKLDDFEIKQRLRIYQEIEGIIQEFLK